MSHFTVLVIGENPEKQLQPYHEYECTGTEDEYVVDVDYTDQINNDLNRELFVGKRKDNQELDYHFYEDKAQKELESYEKMTRLEYLNKSEEDLDEYIKGGFGVTKKDGVWYRKTNPNAKWDWYELGGRWTGMLKMKKGAVGQLGRPGLMTEEAEEGYTDSALKKDIDFEGMRNEAAEKAAERYDSAMAVIGNLPVNESWDNLRKRFDTEGKTIEEAREAYWAQERCVASRQSKVDALEWDGPDEFLVSREEYIQDARNSATLTFAIVKDSKWYERGKMGWWACVSDEKDGDVWSEEFSKLLDSVSDDTLISIYDCHI